MSNLGDSNTPIEGQSFGLPAGAELGEDSGDVVIKDSSGTIILRRNETASEWQFEGTDLSGINAIDAGEVSTEQLGSDRHYVAAYSGSDPDVRLDNALADASDNDTIFLEKEVYESDRTISTACRFVGVGAGGTTINGIWTLDSTFISVENVTTSTDVEFVIEQPVVSITECQFGSDYPVTVNADRFRFVNNEGGTLTFASGTSQGIVDSCTRTSVTDNGANTVGDVA